MTDIYTYIGCYISRHLNSNINLHETGLGNDKDIGFVILHCKQG